YNVQIRVVVGEERCCRFADGRAVTRLLLQEVCDDRAPIMCSPVRLVDEPFEPRRFGRARDMNGRGILTLRPYWRRQPYLSDERGAPRAPPSYARGHLGDLRRTARTPLIPQTAALHLRSAAVPRLAMCSGDNGKGTRPCIIPPVTRRMSPSVQCNAAVTHLSSPRHSRARRRCTRCPNIECQGLI